MLDYPYLKDHYKIIAIDLSKQQALVAAPRSVQQINFTTNLDRDDVATMFFIIEEAKETIFLVSTRNRRSFVSVILLNAISSNNLIFISTK